VDVVELPAHIEAGEGFRETTSVLGRIVTVSESFTLPQQAVVTYK